MRSGRTTVVSLLKGQLYETQKEIKELEEQTSAERIKKRMQEDLESVQQAASQHASAAVDLEEARLGLEKRLKRLQLANADIAAETRSLDAQLAGENSSRLLPLDEKRTQLLVQGRITDLEKVLTRTRDSREADEKMGEMSHAELDEPKVADPAPVAAECGSKSQSREPKSMQTSTDGPMNDTNGATVGAVGKVASGGHVSRRV
jgi:hypothetical protein